MAGLATAAPANELKPRWAMPGKQLSKRSSYRVDRVAVSTGTQKSAVKAAVKAYNKYGIPMPAALKDAHAALRQAEAIVLKDGHKKGKKGKGAKGAKGSKGSKGSKGGAGSAAGNATSTAGSASPSAGAGSTSDSGNAGNGTAGVGAATNGAASGQAGTVAATPEANDVEFLAPITVGDQTMMMDFDTGSSDLYDPPKLLER